MERFQRIAAWDLKYHFARDFNIGGEGIIGMGTITGNPKNALVLGGFGERQL